MEFRADIHCHTNCSDGTDEPRALLHLAKQAGLQGLSITDHDSIGGCLEFLQRHPAADDFFISEEIECLFPGLPLKVHIGAYGINEHIHREIQPLRANVYEAAAYLRDQRLFFTLNHLFFFLDRQMLLGDYLRALLPLFSAFAVRNGTMLETHNRLTEDIVAERRRTGCAVIHIRRLDKFTNTLLEGDRVTDTGRRAGPRMTPLRMENRLRRRGCA